MRRLSGLGRAAASPLAILSLAAPLAIVAVLVKLGWIDGAAAVAARSVRAWAVAVALAVLASFALAAVERRLASALAWAAVALVGVQLAATRAWRLDGILDAGEGEQWPTWRSLSFGSATRPPDARLLALPTDASGMAELEIDGREVAVAVGREVALGDGLTVRVRSSLGAPSFEVRRAAGGEEGTGLLKLVPGERTWFEAGLLPHRFYVTLARDGSALRLRVQRGKVRLLDRDVAVGEVVEVEGLAVSFGPGARWSPIEMHRRPPLWPAVAAGALAVAAAAVAWRTRRSRA